MKKIKILIFLFALMLFTGCSGNYDVKINNDLSVSEKLNLYVENNSDMYKKTVQIFEENKIKREKYDVRIVNNQINIKYREKFNSIDDYILNSKIYHQLYNDINYNRDNKTVDIYANEPLKINDSFNISNSIDIDSLKINITNPFKTIVSNEDEINGDTYTWNINKDTPKKAISMQFTLNNKGISIGNIITIVVLMTSIILLAVIITKNSRKTNKF